MVSFSIGVAVPIPTLPFFVTTKSVVPTAKSPFGMVVVPDPITEIEFPKYPFPEVSIAPAVEVETPTPSPPVKYPSPTTESSCAGVPVAIPTEAPKSALPVACRVEEALNAPTRFKAPSVPKFALLTPPVQKLSAVEVARTDEAKSFSTSK